jgi:hypothetical protein
MEKILATHAEQIANPLLKKDLLHVAAGVGAFPI